MSVANGAVRVSQGGVRVSQGGDKDFKLDAAFGEGATDEEVSNGASFYLALVASVDRLRRGRARRV